MAQPSEDAVKQRITSHMNKDHAESLSRYLESYAGVSYISARSPKLIDLDLSSMKITSAGQTYTIPITPPLSSYQEARPRLVAMHEECGQKLGRDPVTVKKFIWPGFVRSSILAGVFLGLFCFADGSNFAPGSLLAQTVFKPVPSVARIIQEYHAQIFWGVLLLHLGEASLMVSWLKKYNVRLFSRTWWLWVAFTAMEGYGCGSAFRREVKKERAMKAAKAGKH